jgi:hypothetical protein
VFLGLRHLHPASSRGPAYQNLMKYFGRTAEVSSGPKLNSLEERANDKKNANRTRKEKP